MKRFKGVNGFPLAIIIFLSYKVGFNKGKLQGYKDRLYEESESRYWYGDDKYNGEAKTE